MVSWQGRVPNPTACPIGTAWGCYSVIQILTTLLNVCGSDLHERKLFFSAYVPRTKIS